MAGQTLTRNPHLERFVVAAPIQVAMFDREMRYLAASPGWADKYGLPANVEGLSHYDLFPNLPDRWKDVHRRGQSGETISQKDDEYVLPSGERRYLDWSVAPWRCDDGVDIGGILIFATDIQALKQSEQLAKENEAHMRDLFEGVPVAYQALDTDGFWLDANQRMADLLGFETVERMIGLNFYDFCSEEARAAKPLEMLKRTSPLKGELTLTRRDGKSVMVEIVGRIERDLNGACVRAHCALFDITERKKVEEDRARLNIVLEQEVEQRTRELAEAVTALRELATHDPLTGLANRLAANGRLEAEFAMFQRTRRPFSILMIDVDDFKDINDSLGHAAGDEALRQLSRIFKDNIRVSDMVARLGGDEFMAILPDTGLSAAMATAEKLRAAVAKASLHDVTISIGVTTVSAADDVYDGVLKRADGHLYEAKKMGRNRIFPDG